MPSIPARLRWLHPPPSGCHCDDCRLVSFDPSVSGGGRKSRQPGEPASPPTRSVPSWCQGSAEAVLTCQHAQPPDRPLPWLGSGQAHMPSVNAQGRQLLTLFCAHQTCEANGAPEGSAASGLTDPCRFPRVLPIRTWHAIWVFRRVPASASDALSAQQIAFCAEGVPVATANLLRPSRVGFPG